MERVKSVSRGRGKRTAVGHGQPAAPFGVQCPDSPARSERVQAFTCWARDKRIDKFLSTRFLLHSSHTQPKSLLRSSLFGSTCLHIFPLFYSPQLKHHGQSRYVKTGRVRGSHSCSPAVTPFAASRRRNTETDGGWCLVVAGASGGIGQPLSLLLKSSPLVSELSLYDVVNTPGVAADLSHISSPAVSLDSLTFGEEPQLTAVTEGQGFLAQG